MLLRLIGLIRYVNLGVIYCIGMELRNFVVAIPYPFRCGLYEGARDRYVASRYPSSYVYTRWYMFQYGFVCAFVSFMMNFACEFIGFYRFSRFFRVVVRFLVTSGERYRIIFGVSILMFFGCNFAMLIRFGARAVYHFGNNSFCVIKLSVASL